MRVAILSEFFWPGGRTEVIRAREPWARKETYTFESHDSDDIYTVQKGELPYQEHYMVDSFFLLPEVTQEVLDYFNKRGFSMAYGSTFRSLGKRHA